MGAEVADALRRATVAIDTESASTNTLAPGERSALESRRTELRRALAPSDDNGICSTLATLAKMGARSEHNPQVALGLVKQDIADLRHVPYFALAEAAAAFRQGEIGDGCWRPTSGQLAIEGGRRARAFQTELQKIGRVLESPRLSRNPEPRISKEQWAHLGARLAAAASSSQGVVAT